MKKILVTTDLSDNSKSALRFAIQLASQSGHRLTFFYSHHILRPTSWSEASFVSFEKNELTEASKKLFEFVLSVYRYLKIDAGQPQCVVISGKTTDREIMDYSVKNHFDYICLSRRGHGKTARLFGSNTSTLIKKSKVPILAVPDIYRTKRIKTITYISDLLNLDGELKKVSAFSNPLGADVSLLHFKSPIDNLPDGKHLNAIQEILAKYNVNASYKKLDYEKTLIENINKVIKYSNPSMLIMFTNQKRTFFEKIFMSSISAEFSSIVKIPLLIFNKD